MTESDASLVARLREGDVTAADTLLRRHFRASYLVALAGVGNRADAEDVCQDAFIRCLEKIDECRQPERFVGWLLQIVRNTAHNRTDYLRVRRAESIDSVDISSESRTDRDAEGQELRESLERALAQLNGIQREVVLLHDLEGLRHAEIGVRLQLSEGMSRRHLSDARKTLRELLGDYATIRPDHD